MGWHMGFGMDFNKDFDHKDFDMDSVRMGPILTAAPAIASTDFQYLIARHQFDF